MGAPIALALAILCYASPCGVGFYLCFPPVGALGALVLA
jgi:hypothetical protein